MAEPIVHHNKCEPERRSQELNYSDDDDAFRKKIKDIKFDVKCRGCCFAYLLIEKRYKSFHGDFDGVAYRKEWVSCEEILNAELKMPDGKCRKRFQIQITKDDELDRAKHRAVEGGKTFHFYLPTEEEEQTELLRLGQSHIYEVRMESISIEGITFKNLADVRLSYTTATLVELYREQERERKKKEKERKQGENMAETNDKRNGDEDNGKEEIRSEKRRSDKDSSNEDKSDEDDDDEDKNDEDEDDEDKSDEDENDDGNGNGRNGEERRIDEGNDDEGNGKKERKKRERQKGLTNGSLYTKQDNKKTLKASPGIKKKTSVEDKRSQREA